MTEEEKAIESENDLIWIQNQLRVPKKHRNDFGGFNYRNAEDIIEAVKPLCEERGCKLVLKDKISIVGAKLPIMVGNRKNAKGDDEDYVMSGPRIYVKTTAVFIDSKGEKTKVPGYAREPIDKKGMDDSQLTGSAASYAAKRALGNLFLLDDNRDADDLPATSEDEIAWFLDVIENEEAGKLYHYKINSDGKYNALLRSAAPKGKMTVFKRETEELAFKGYKQAEENALNLITCAENRDVEGIKEITEQLVKEEKELAWMQLPKAIHTKIQDLLVE